MFNDNVPILTITGSDGTGGSGIQADIKTCELLGTYALTVVTAVTVQDSRGIRSTHSIPSPVIHDQLFGIISDRHPRVAKIGMLCDAESARVVSGHLQKFSHVVLDAAFLTSRGERIASTDTIRAICTHIVPHCDIVILKHSEAEILLGHIPHDKESRLRTSRQLLHLLQVPAIIVQGNHSDSEFTDDLFSTTDAHQFFSLPDYSRRNTHGLASTLSASIASYLALGQSLSTAVASAYAFIQSLTVYSVTSGLGCQSSVSRIGSERRRSEITPRQQECYNSMMQLISNHLRQHHDIAFYASELNISSRYLAQIISVVAHKTPKQLIAECLIAEGSSMLESTTMSIQEIAFALGFSSQSQFTNLFKRIKSVAPTEYRRLKN